MRTQVSEQALRPRQVLSFFFLREKENIELGREEGGLGQGETGKNDENILYKNVQLKNEYKEY